MHNVVAPHKCEYENTDMPNEIYTQTKKTNTSMISTLFFSKDMFVYNFFDCYYQTPTHTYTDINRLKIGLQNAWLFGVQCAHFGQAAV